MDQQNLKTASHYVNNLLLSRGLLRNGTPIEFVHPSKGEGGKEATIAKTINLVHDMVLRRDRESDALSNLSQTITSMRTTTAQQNQTIARLEARNADLERQLSLSNAQERSAKSSLKVAENRYKVLREDMVRLKATVSQIRAQCANDVRKRDSEIARLKKYLDVRRGRDAVSQVGVTIITPGITRSKHATTPGQGAADLESPSYSLKEETTDFLTQLSQSLSDENDSLIRLVQGTIATLRELQGLPESTQGVTTYDTFNDPNVSINMPPSYEKLAMDMDELLEHLRSLLTNPSFVPLEEVEVREEEIMRLREGWEKMESRWREAIYLMNSWRKRMMENGDTINMDDLKKGLNLDSENLIPVKPSRMSISSRRSSGQCSVSQDDIFQDESKVEEEFAGQDISPVAAKVSSVFPAPNILQFTSGNARLSPSPKRVAYQANSPEIGAIFDALSDDEDVAILETLANEGSPSPSKKRKSEDSESTLTIQEKLEKAEAEAALAAEARHQAELQKNLKPPAVKRTAIPRKIRSKRRSTLSPEELEGLMGV